MGGQKKGTVHVERHSLSRVRFWATNTIWMLYPEEGHSPNQGQVIVMYLSRSAPLLPEIPGSCSIHVGVLNERYQMIK